MNEVVTQQGNIVPRVANPFDGERKSVAQVVGGAAEIQRAVAEVQAKIVVAKQFPRVRHECLDKIITECTRHTLAEQAEYSYTRGGTEVSGPSIRLAEVLAANWGNFSYGWREVNRRVDAAGVGISEVIATAWDYETNVQSVREFNVRHWRDTKKGGYAIKDERDIYELVANMAARRMRACILNVIPGDVVEQAQKQCELTLSVQEQITPERLKSLVEAFEKLGVTKSQIEKRIGRRLDAESLKGNGAVIVALRKVYNGIKEGMSKVEDFFEPEAMPAGEGKTAPIATSAEGEPYNAETGELSDWDSVVDELVAGLQGCKSAKDVVEYAQENAEMIGKIDASKARAASEKWAAAYLKRLEDFQPKKGK